MSFWKSNNSILQNSYSYAQYHWHVYLKIFKINVVKLLYETTFLSIVESKQWSLSRCIHIQTDWRPFAFPCVKQLIHFILLTAVYIWPGLFFKSKSTPWFKLQPWTFSYAHARRKWSSLDWWKFWTFLDRNFGFLIFNPYLRVLLAEMADRHCLPTSLQIWKFNVYLLKCILSSVNINT